MLIIRLISSVSIMMIILLITMLIIRLMSSDHNVVDPTMIALPMLMFIYVRMHLHTQGVRCGGRSTFREPVVRDNLIEALGAVVPFPDEALGARAAEAQPGRVVSSLQKD